MQCNRHARTRTNFLRVYPHYPDIHLMWGINFSFSFVIAGVDSSLGKMPLFGGKAKYDSRLMAKYNLKELLGRWALKFSEQVGKWVSGGEGRRWEWEWGAQSPPIQEGGVLLSKPTSWTKNCRRALIGIMHGTTVFVLLSKMQVLGDHYFMIVTTAALQCTSSWGAKCLKTPVEQPASLQLLCTLCSRQDKHSHCILLMYVVVVKRVWWHRLYCTMSSCTLVVVRPPAYLLWKDLMVVMMAYILF